MIDSNNSFLLNHVFQSSLPKLLKIFALRRIKQNSMPGSGIFRGDTKQTIIVGLESDTKKVLNITRIHGRRYRKNQLRRMQL